MDLKKLVDIIHRQEALVRVNHFNNRDALQLGCLAAAEAEQRGIAVSIAVYGAAGAAMFLHLMSGTNANNQLWMERKRGTVAIWEHSSLRAWANELLYGKTVDVAGLDPAKYVYYGGGFPVFMQTGELVAILAISGLDHLDDHQFAVDCLAKWVGIKKVPNVHEAE